MNTRFLGAALAVVVCGACGGEAAEEPPGGVATPSASGTPAGDGTPAVVTFAEHVAPIVFRSCAPCHRPGESAPFPLLTYADVGPRARQIAEVTRSGYMPPWLPSAGHGEFSGDRSLAPEAIATIKRWAENDAPEGDPALTPPIPKVTPGWQLGEPDLIVRMGEPFRVPAEGQDVFRNFVIPLPVERTRFVQAVELRPGNNRVVHHAIMEIDRTSASRDFDARDEEPGFPGMHMPGSDPPAGHFLGWTPGKVPRRVPEGMAWPLQRGSDLVLQLHMLPTGKPETIQCSVGLYFTERPPAKTPTVVELRNDELDIRPGQSAYVAEDSMVLPVTVDATMIYPHAHYLGKRMEVFADLPDGSRKHLLLIQDWDFNWQDEYYYASPPHLPKGTRLTMRYTFDNSAQNPRNPHNPPRHVKYGFQSSDEMATLTLQVLTETKEARNELREALCRHKVERNPDYWTARNNLGTVLAERGKFDEAATHLRAGLKIEPRSADLHLNLGSVLAAQNQLDEAMKSFLEALKIAPKNPDVHFNLALVEKARGRWDKVAEHCRAVLAVSPRDAVAHRELGDALFRLTRLDDAAKAFSDAVRVAPRDYLSHYRLGTVRFRQRRLEEATTAFLDVLEIRKIPDAHAAVARVYVARRMRAEARKHLEAAVNIAAPNAQPRYMARLALVLSADPTCPANETASLIRTAEMAARLTGRKDPGVLDSLAVAYAAAGEFERAIRTGQEAARLAAARRAAKLHADIRKRLALYRAGKPYRLAQ